jgi:hypothetical protein
MKSIQVAVVLLVASAVAGCGAEMLAVVIVASATKRDTFCKTSSGDLYTRAKGDCDAADTEIEFEAYRLLY